MDTAVLDVVDVEVSEAQQEALEKTFQNELVDTLNGEDTAKVVVRSKNQYVKEPQGFEIASEEQTVTRTT